MLKYKGFTLIEILVVMGIIVFFTGLVLVNYKTGGNKFALQRSVNKLAQDIRRAEQMAMSMKKFSCSSGELRGYGIKFDKTLTTYNYKIWAKCNSSNEETTIDGAIEKGVSISELNSKKSGSPDAFYDIFFVFFYPPDPNVDFEDIDGNNIDADIVEIILEVKDSSFPSMSITINKAGLVEIE